MVQVVASCWIACVLRFVVAFVADWLRSKVCLMIMVIGDDDGGGSGGITMDLIAQQ